MTVGSAGNEQIGCNQRDRKGVRWSSDCETDGRSGLNRGSTIGGETRRFAIAIGGNFAIERRPSI